VSHDFCNERAVDVTTIEKIQDAQGQRSLATITGGGEGVFKKWWWLLLLLLAIIIILWLLMRKKH
jgi:hypothetical protein